MAVEKVTFQCSSDLRLDKVVATLVQKASDFRSTVYLIESGRRANAKSLLGVIALGLENGAEVEVSADGTDANEAVKSLVEYLKDPKV